MEISIVIPTRDRPAALARCLAALAATSRRARCVVDDGSRDRERRRGARASRPRRGSSARPGAGPAAARNLGARAAEGEVVCFTDDDCEPEPGWAPALAAAAAAARRRRAAGRSRRRGARATVRRLAGDRRAPDARLARPGRPAGSASPRPATSPSPARRSRRLPFDESFPDRRRRGPRLERPRGRAPASRPCTCPRRSSFTARRLDARRLRPPAVPLRARRGALPGRGAGPAAWRGRRSTPGWCGGVRGRAGGRGAGASPRRLRPRRGWSPSG